MDVPLLLCIDGSVCACTCMSVCVCGSAMFLGGARDSGEVCSCYFCSSSCQFLLTEARSAVSIMYDCGLQGGMVSDSLIKLKENKPII